ncbi:hypothetical protein ACPF38_003585 [Vibrio cholerae]
MSKEIRLITLDPPYSRYFKHLVESLEKSTKLTLKKHYISALGYIIFGFRNAKLVKINIARKSPTISSKKRVINLARKLNYQLSPKILYRSAQYVEWLREEIEHHQVNTCLLYNATRFNHVLAISLFQEMGVSYYVFERGTQRGRTTTLLSNPDLVSLPKLEEPIDSELMDIKHYGTESVADYALFSLFLLLDHLGKLLGLNFESPDKALRKKRYTKILYQWVKAKYSPTPILNQKYLLVPLQLEYDSQVRLFSKFSTTQEFIDTVEEGFYRSTLSKDHILVFSTHPFECKKYQFDRRSQCFFGKTRALMEEAVAIITINSTAGMEALEKLKPCFVFGDAIYKEESVVLPVTSETFTQSLNKWHKKPWTPSWENVDQVKRRILVSTQVSGSVYKYDSEALEQVRQKIVS